MLHYTAKRVAYGLRAARYDGCDDDEAHNKE
jgi:hypothetical protein